MVQNIPSLTFSVYEDLNSNNQSPNQIPTTSNYTHHTPSSSIFRLDVTPQTQQTQLNLPNPFGSSHYPRHNNFSTSSSTTSQQIMFITPQQQQQQAQNLVLYSHSPLSPRPFCQLSERKKMRENPDREAFMNISNIFKRDGSNFKIKPILCSDRKQYTDNSLSMQLKYEEQGDPMARLGVRALR